MNEYDHDIARAVLRASQAGDRDPFSILLLPPSRRTLAEARTAYKKLLFLHPDKNPENPEAGEAFKLVVAAFDSIRKLADRSDRRDDDIVHDQVNRWRAFTTTSRSSIDTRGPILDSVRAHCGSNVLKQQSAWRTSDEVHTIKKMRYDSNAHICNAGTYCGRDDDLNKYNDSNKDELNSFGIENRKSTIEDELKASNNMENDHLSLVSPITEASPGKQNHRNGEDIVDQKCSWGSARRWQQLWLSGTGSVATMSREHPKDSVFSMSHDILQIHRRASPTPKPARKSAKTKLIEFYGNAEKADEVSEGAKVVDIVDKINQYRCKGKLTPFTGSQSDDSDEQQNENSIENSKQHPSIEKIQECTVSKSNPKQQSWMDRNMLSREILMNVVRETNDSQQSSIHAKLSRDLRRHRQKMASRRSGRRVKSQKILTHQ